MRTRYVVPCLICLLAVSCQPDEGGGGGGGSKPRANDDTAVTRLDHPREILVLANDSGVSSVDSVTQGAIGAVVNNGTSVTYTPQAGTSGVDTFTYTASNSKGKTSTATVTITISTAISNTDPLAVPDIIDTAVDLPVTFDVLANDSDPDGDPLTYSIIAAPTNGSAFVEADNRLTYTPNTGFMGVDVMEYQLNDDQGGSATAFIAVVINQTLVAPGSPTSQAITDLATVNPNTFIDIDVLANDLNTTGSPLAVATFSQPWNGQGSVTDQGGGVLRYTAIAAAAGLDYFFYTINLPGGDITAAMVIVTINAVPVAVADFAEVDPGQLVGISPLANDYDPNSHTFSIVSFTTPANGTLIDLGGGAFNYVADTGHSIETFTYTIEDPFGLQAVGTVTIGVSNPPVANNDTGMGGAQIDVDVLANDTDPDSDPLSVKSFTNGANGTVSDLGGGVLRYEPQVGFEGLDSFTYVCQDSFLRTASATVSVVVQDWTPPAPISDLTVIRSATPDTITLRWTAPGDSGATGTASGYVIKTAAFSFTPGVFDTMTTVPQSMTPVQSGQQESLTITLPWYTGTHYFAIKAFDEIPNTGAMSNLASVNTNAIATFPAATYDFGPSPMGGSVNHQFQITNQSTIVDLEISSLQISGNADYALTAGAVSGTPVLLTPGQSHNFTVTLSPTATGALSAAVTIQHTSSSVSQPYVINLSGEGANVAPTFKIRTEVLGPGQTVNFQIDISDGNSNLPGTDDLVAASIDLSQFGGSATQALTLVNTVNPTTKRFTASVATVSAPADVYLLPVTATDSASNTSTALATVVLSNGTIRSVGAGQTYSTIQNGINAAINGDVVLVREGTYTGSGNLQIGLFGKQITVCAEYTPGHCTITHPLGHTAFQLVGTGESNAAWITGFRFFDCDHGVLLIDNSSPTIANCDFEDCANTGIYCSGGAVGPLIRDCRAQNFGTGYVMLLDSTGQTVTATTTIQRVETRNCWIAVRAANVSVVLEDCAFLENTGSGLPTVELLADFNVVPSVLTCQMNRCRIDSTTGFALLANSSTAPAVANITLDGCVFTNSATGAVSVAYNSTDSCQFTAKNCSFDTLGWDAIVLVGNQAAHDFSVHNCAFREYGNGGNYSAVDAQLDSNSTLALSHLSAYGTGSGPAIYVRGGGSGTFTIADCATHTVSAAMNLDAGAGTVSNCCASNTVNIGTATVNGGAGFVHGQNGNIVADPLFVDAPNGNLRLQHVAAGQASDSPCIDAGSQPALAAGLDAKTTRTDGVTDSGTVDIGYHYDP